MHSRSALCVLLSTAWLVDAFLINPVPRTTGRKECAFGLDYSRSPHQVAFVQAACGVPADDQLDAASLRVTEPTICDPSVKQLSGHVDIGKGKNLFFWFFEARTSPETAPFILWQNGGPGGSSMMGLVIENIGPCTVINNGSDVKRNPYSWNEFANILFLDQPSDIGYSYLSTLPTQENYLTNSKDAGEDVWTFLQLFFDKYPQYVDLPFHSAAESYGGHYAPWVAHAIHEHNKAIGSGEDTTHRHIKLESIVLANAAVNGRYQGPAKVDWFCNGPYKDKFGLNATTCASLKAQASACDGAYARCEQTGLPVHCFQTLQCSSLYELPTLEWNPYNVILPCAAPEHVTCYAESIWADDWLNLISTKLALGVNPSRDYIGINFEVNLAFTISGDQGTSTSHLLPPLLDDGIRLLNYAGKADSVCDYFGNLAWMLELKDHPFADEFTAVKTRDWVTVDGVKAGDVRSAGNGSCVFVAVDDAGHMVPMDHPDRALDLMRRWIFNEPL